MTVSIYGCQNTKEAVGAILDDVKQDIQSKYNANGKDSNKLNFSLTNVFSHMRGEILFKFPYNNIFVLVPLAIFKNLM